MALVNIDFSFVNHFSPSVFRNTWRSMWWCCVMLHADKQPCNCKSCIQISTMKTSRFYNMWACWKVLDEGIIFLKNLKKLEPTKKKKNRRQPNNKNPTNLKAFFSATCLNPFWVRWKNLTDWNAATCKAYSNQQTVLMRRLFHFWQSNLF